MNTSNHFNRRPQAGPIHPTPEQQKVAESHSDVNSAPRTDQPASSSIPGEPKHPVTRPFLRVAGRARRQRTRDLAQAVTLRASDIWILFGIAPSTVCDLATHPDPAKRLPSSLTPGRNGRKGIRLFQRSEVEAWIARYRTT